MGRMIKLIATDMDGTLLNLMKYKMDFMKFLIN